jgi:tRNA nucleotidyltransferase/poly(A) polymerase
MTVQIYKVGGAVRDEFLGVKSKDIDFAVEAPSYEAMRDYIAVNGKIFLEKPEYFTIRAKLNGTDADFVLCRKEHGYSDGRRPDLVTQGDIYDDLSRRDFTVNAIAIRVSDGEVFDPHSGVRDIAKRVVRCVGNAEDRFSEDSLRMLRAVRFHITKQFSLDRDIYFALENKTLLDKLENVSKERIREELNRCFKHNTLETLIMFERFPKLRDVVFGSNDTLWLEATNKDR